MDGPAATWSGRPAFTYVPDILPCISFGSTSHIMNRALELGIVDGRAATWFGRPAFAYVPDILPCFSFRSTWHILTCALELGIALSESCPCAWASGSKRLPPDDPLDPRTIHEEHDHKWSLVVASRPQVSRCSFQILRCSGGLQSLHLDLSTHGSSCSNQQEFSRETC